MLRAVAMEVINFLASSTSMFFRVSVFWIQVGLFGGCAAAPGEAGRPAQGTSSSSGLRSPAQTPDSAFEQRPAPSTKDGTSWRGAPFGRLELADQSLSIGLPNGKGWRRAARRGTWSGLTHEESKSELWVRHVVARRTITVDECEKESRMSFRLLRNEEESVHQRPLSSPAGYGGRVFVHLSNNDGARVEAFGVGVSRCFALVFLIDDSPGFSERIDIVLNEVLRSVAVTSASGKAPIREIL